ncbi:toll-like receptor 13 isoform X2 [Teleopsis dalmanni]|uniref:toll-like receptor 13 isoform X2 n=1 Tax=Teleopsis dalmanni TaxID=139649 RepID=UPI0018CD7204|nr:toll-like receptor 13 isoform X2 [Teleopsis dalmanni]
MADCFAFQLMIILSFNLALAMAPLKIIDSCVWTCICDEYLKRGRVNCSYQLLEDAIIYSNSPIAYLDLSYNNVKVLKDDTFMAHFNIIELNLTHNSIKFIEANSFSNLLYLHVLDLSHNEMEALHADTFKSNLFLNKIDLSQNKFSDLKNVPFIINHSVRFLSLRSCQINQINSTMFSEMPQLQELDLSNNLLIMINFDNFIYLKRLTFMNITGNSFLTCNEMLKANLKEFQKRYIKIDETVCKLFNEEFMISTVKPIAEYLLSDESNINEKQANTNDSATIDPEMICSALNNYMGASCNISLPISFCEVYARYLEINPENKTAFKETKCYRQDDVHFSFFAGTLLGFLTVGFMSFCLACIQYFRTKAEEKEKENDEPEYRTHGTFTDSDSSDY